MAALHQPSVVRSRTTRWFYNASGDYLCSCWPDGVDLAPDYLRETMDRAAYYYDHPGFPGVIVDGSDMDGELCVFPPIPGRDFVPLGVAVRQERTEQVW